MSSVGRSMLGFTLTCTTWAVSMICKWLAMFLFSCLWITWLHLLFYRSGFKSVRPSWLHLSTVPLRNLHRTLLQWHSVPTVCHMTVIVSSWLLVLPEPSFDNGSVIPCSGSSSCHGRAASYHSVIIRWLGLTSSRAGSKPGGFRFLWLRVFLK